MSARRREAELLIQSEQGVDSPSSFCWGMRMLRRSHFALSLTLFHWFAFSPSFLNLAFASLSITHACHFHFSSLPSLSLSFSQRVLSVPLSHSLVISLTLRALSTVKADLLPTKTHTHTDSPTHTHTHKPAAADNVLLSLPPSSFSH